MAGTLATLIIRLGVDASQVTTALAAVQSTVQKASTAISIAAGAGAIAFTAGMIASTKAAIEWEQQYAGVKRTLDVSGLSAEQAEQAYRNVEMQLRDLTKLYPITHEMVAQLGQQAGALGVPRDAVDEFVRLAGTISRISDDLTPEATGFALGKIQTVMGMAAEEYEALGSSLAALGTQGASTEGEILAMSENIAGAAALLGFSKDQMLAWAAAIANTGEEAEAGGSSFSRFGLGLGKIVAEGTDKLDALGRITGMTRDQFAAMWDADTSGAMKAVIDGLGEIDGAARQLAMREIGFTDIRITRAILKLTANTDNLNETLGISSKAWAERTELQKRSAIVFGTTSGRIQVSMNKINDAMINIGGAFLPIVAALADGIGNIADAIGTWIGENQDLWNSLAPLLTLLSSIIALKFGWKMLHWLLPIGNSGHLLMQAWQGVIDTGIIAPIKAALVKGIKLPGTLIRGAAGRLGTIAGGAFGMAFKAASLVGLVLLIKEMIDEWNKVKSDMDTAAAKISSEGDRFLAGMPTRPEVEERIKALKAAGDGLTGFQDIWWEVSHAASGTVFGSFFDLFGKQPVNVVNDEIKKMEGYLGRLGSAATGEVNDAIQEMMNASSGAVRAQGRALALLGENAINEAGDIVDEGGNVIVEGLTTMSGKLYAAWSSVREQMEEGPEFQSTAQRIKAFNKTIAEDWKWLEAAIEANDPLETLNWANKLAMDTRALEEFRRRADFKMDDVATQLAIAGVDIEGTFLDVKTSADKTKTGVTESIDTMGNDVTASIVAETPLAAAAADGMRAGIETPLSTMPAYTWGQHIGQNLASGLDSQYTNVADSASSLGGAIRSKLAFSSPPRSGPLSDIRSWGPHMIATWTGSTEAALGRVETTGERLARAMSPAARLSASQVISRASGRVRGGDRWDAIQAGQGRERRENHYHIGTLIANDHGIDELDRRIERRRKLRTRDRRLVGDVN